MNKVNFETRDIKLDDESINKIKINEHPLHRKCIK